MDERNKRTSGITMVALAVTIVVLLILASVTIGALFGENGLINNVRNRKNNAYQKLVNEEVKQITTEYDIANSGETLEEFLEEKVKEGRVDEVTRKDDKTLEVKKDGYTVEVESENRDFSLIVEAYIGTYDEKTHDVISNLEVKPTDAKIEYSTDNGKTYSATMPTITNASSVQVTVRASRIGYKTETVTKTAIVNKAEGKVTLSATSGTITYPDSTTFMVSGNTGNLSVSSNSTNIATASISGSTVTVKPGTTAGKATITVTSAAATNYNAKSATYTATVNNGTITLSATPYTGTYDGKAHNAITSVTVNPSDAKIEYSTDGTNYSTTMPTVTNSSSFTVTVRASKAGYKTQITTQTVKVNKAAGTLTLSATSGTLTYPTSGTFTVSGNTGTLSVASSNTNIATASISGNTVTVKPGTTAGKATITVTSAATTNYNEKSATYTATVNNGTISLSATPYTGTYDGKAHNAITKVTVTPSDAKIEYSTNGTTYSTTMPTVTNSSSFTVTVRASKAGYKTQSTTQTVKVNKATGKLTLSANSGTIEYPATSTTFTVSGNTGTLSVSSSNTSVATVSISGSTVTIKSVGAGTATITVKSAASTNYNEKTATYAVTVKYPTFTGYSGVGYYADTDGDGTPDGIIFEDFKNGGSGTWEKNSNVSYSIPTVSSTKSYYISQTNYKGLFGTKDVLTATGSGNARFYVMALSDYNNSATYNYSDAIKIKSGEWSVPTINEWAAFAGQLVIYNYYVYGLNEIYWSSSVWNPFNQSTFSVYCMRFSYSDIVTENYSKCHVRLARTF